MRRHCCLPFNLPRLARVVSEAEDVAGAGWGPEVVFETLLLQPVANDYREVVVAAEMEYKNHSDPESY